MKSCAVLLILLTLLTGCRDIPQPAGKTLADWQNAALSRHLAGETATALTAAAKQVKENSRHHEYPDLARFIRETTPEKGSELSREMLWKSFELCNVQFSGDPETMIREMRAGELRSHAAILIAEKQYLDQIVWKSPAEEERNRELHSELSRLFGSLPFGELANIKLAAPGTPLPDLSGASRNLTQDPAEALQIAGVISLMPDEIRRQQIANPQFKVEGVLNEIQFLAASYALQLDRTSLLKIRNEYKNSPSEEKLLQYRKWYYRTLLDISRIPAKRGTKEDQQFINSMLLLQDSF